MPKTVVGTVLQIVVTQYNPSYFPITVQTGTGINDYGTYYIPAGEITLDAKPATLLDLCGVLINPDHVLNAELTVDPNKYVEVRTAHFTTGRSASQLPVNANKS